MKEMLIDESYLVCKNVTMAKSEKQTGANGRKHTGSIDDGFHRINDLCPWRSVSRHLRTQKEKSQFAGGHELFKSGRYFHIHKQI